MKSSEEEQGLWCGSMGRKGWEICHRTSPNAPGLKVKTQRVEQLSWHLMCSGSTMVAGGAMHGGV